MRLAALYPALFSGRVQGLDLDFANGRFGLNGPYRSRLLDLPGATFSRVGAGTALDASGALIQFATGVPRITSRGLLVEEARTNLLLNSAALATQSVTVAATAYTLSFFGTGTVTLSGASTAGPLVGTGSANRVSLTFTPSAGTLTLTVSGSVTFANLEAGSFPTSPIVTGGAAATRGADNPILTGLPPHRAGVTLLAEVVNEDASPFFRGIAGLNDGVAVSHRVTLQRVAAGALGARATIAGVAYSPGDLAWPGGVGVKKVGLSVMPGRAISAVNGALSSASAPPSVPLFNQLWMGIGDPGSGVASLEGYIPRIRVLPYAVADAALQAMTQ